MMGFTKLDDGIIYSSIMGEDDSVFRVWIILLASCKSTGISPLSPVFIKNITGKSLDEVNRCLNVLSLPDLSSRSKNDEGRRIRSVDGGYEVINYLKYRDFTYSDSPEAIKKRKQRRGDKKGRVPDISGHSASASASASKEEESEKEKKYHYLSELLITKIKLSGTQMKIIPGKLIPKWAQDFRLMVEQDKKTEKQIEEIIEAIFADEFWFKVIRSAGSLREKWITGKLDGLKVPQNAQEGQGQAKDLTPWQELCRDSGDPGQRVWDRMIKIWESVEGKLWQEYPFLPKNPSDVVEMQPIFEIMIANKYTDPKEILFKIKQYLKEKNEY